jgi:hypothetical protein
MDLIILNDGLYQLVAVTKEDDGGYLITGKKYVDCFDLCDILRLHLTTYHESMERAYNE